MLERKPFDVEQYIDQIQQRPCFICALVRGDTPGDDLIDQDAEVVVFLNKDPTPVGYTLIAPVAHKEQITADFSPQEDLALQHNVYWVAEAVRQSVETERIYLLL